MLAITPDLIYLFMALSGPLNSYPSYRVLYETTDKEACQTQAAAWNASIAPLKPMYYCLEHAQTKLRAPGASDN